MEAGAPRGGLEPRSKAQSHTDLTLEVALPGWVGTGEHRVPLRHLWSVPAGKAGPGDGGAKVAQLPWLPPSWVGSSWMWGPRLSRSYLQPRGLAQFLTWNSLTR